MIATAMTAKDVAGILQRSPRWARTWMQQHGGFPLGREWRIHPDVFASELHGFAPGNDIVTAPVATVASPYLAVDRAVLAPQATALTMQTALPMDWLAKPPHELFDVSVGGVVQSSSGEVDTAVVDDGPET